MSDFFFLHISFPIQERKRGELSFKDYQRNKTCMAAKCSKISYKLPGCSKIEVLRLFSEKDTNKFTKTVLNAVDI